jgi:hypothetical protein
VARAPRRERTRRRGWRAGTRPARPRGGWAGRRAPGPGRCRGWGPSHPRASAALEAGRAAPVSLTALSQRRPRGSQYARARANRPLFQGRPREAVRPVRVRVRASACACECQRVRVRACATPLSRSPSCPHLSESALRAVPFALCYPPPPPNRASPRNNRPQVHPSIDSSCSAPHPNTHTPPVCTTIPPPGPHRPGPQDRRCGPARRRAGRAGAAPRRRPRPPPPLLTRAHTLPRHALRVRLWTWPGPGRLRGGSGPPALSAVANGRAWARRAQRRRSAPAGRAGPGC